MKRISKLKADIRRNSQYVITIDVIIVEYSPSMFRHVPWVITTTKVVSYHCTHYVSGHKQQHSDVASFLHNSTLIISQ